MKLLRQVAEYSQLVKEMEEKIEVLKEYKELYFETSNLLIQKDAELENQRHVINTTRTTLESLTGENKRLKWLSQNTWTDLDF